MLKLVLTHFLSFIWLPREGNTSTHTHALSLTHAFTYTLTHTHTEESKYIEWLQSSLLPLLSQIPRFLWPWITQNCYISPAKTHSLLRLLHFTHFLFTHHCHHPFLNRKRGTIIFYIFWVGISQSWHYLALFGGTLLAPSLHRLPEGVIVSRER